MKYNEIPSWFFQLIDTSRPDLQKLEAALEQLDRRQLENYYGYYMRASQEIRNPGNGPYINEAIGKLSEDSTEDLTDWIVSQGFDYWNQMDFDDEPLAEAFLRMKAAEEGKANGAELWSHGTSNPDYHDYQWPKDLALAVYEKRFGEDLYDHIDEIMNRVCK